MPPRRVVSRASARDVSVSAAFDIKPDMARVAAAVRLAAAVSPALADARNARRARVVPRGLGSGVTPSKDSNHGAFAQRATKSGAIGPRGGRYLEVLPGPGPDAKYPGGWWGAGTYSESLGRGNGTSTKAIYGGSSGAGEKGAGSFDPFCRDGFESSARDRDVSSSAFGASAGGSQSGFSGDNDATKGINTNAGRADDTPQAGRPNPFEQLWLRLVKPLRDFGFGRTNIWEGGVGLFLIGGIGICALTVNWILGVNFNKMRSYQAFVEFPFACGIQVGTQVRVRGVKVGNVLRYVCQAFSNPGTLFAHTCLTLFV